MVKPRRSRCPLLQIVVFNHECGTVGIEEDVQITGPLPESWSVLSYFTVDKRGINCKKGLTSTIFGVSLIQF